MHQRRATAASAAIAQQRKINDDLIANNNELKLINNAMIKPSLQMSQSQFSLTKLSTQQQQQQNRPKASVTPFKVFFSCFFFYNLFFFLHF